MKLILLHSVRSLSWACNGDKTRTLTQSRYGTPFNCQQLKHGAVGILISYSLILTEAHKICAPTYVTNSSSANGNDNNDDANDTANEDGGNKNINV
jgi:hypothetical protein